MLRTLFQGHEGWALWFFYLLGSFIAYMIARSQFRKRVLKYKREYEQSRRWTSEITGHRHDTLPKYGWDDVFLALLLAIISWFTLLAVAVIKFVNWVQKVEPANWM